MTPEDRAERLRRHPVWPRFEAYYAERHRTRWRRRSPWMLCLAALVALAVLAIL